MASPDENEGMGPVCVDFCSRDFQSPIIGEAVKLATDKLTTGFKVGDAVKTKTQ